MPAWLGLTLAGAFVLVTGYRAYRREWAAALMAAGMAVMAVGMGGIGPHVVHGLWWAVGFTAVALWPVVWPVRWPVSGAVPHLVSGAAMVYMCTAGLALAPGGSAAGPDVALTGASGGLGAGEHEHSGHAALAAAQLGGGSLSVGLFALAGWLLACYYLLASVCALTRRTGDGGLTRTGRAAAEAAMGLGTMIMLGASV